MRGRVQFVGDLPAPKPFELCRYPDQAYCGLLSAGSGYRLLREVVVGLQHGLKDVIVTIQGVEKGKPFEFAETRLETNICQFVPFVSVMRDQHPLTVTNLDSIAHDLQIYEWEQEHIFTMFHRPALTKAWTAAGTYRIRAWHPTLGDREQEIMVAQGGPTSVEFTFAAE